MMRVRRAALAVAFLAGVGVVGSLTMRPPARFPLAPAPPPGLALVRGAFHLHTVRSDGTGTLDEVAAAAAQAGLTFVIVTDHGDGTRPPAPPAYRHGVLVIDAVELSTSGGHYVALGLPIASYPFRGEPSDVVEDVRDAGAFGIATHPESPKAGLAWHDWRARVDGLEWVNVDSEWRDESPLGLAQALLSYPWRPTESLAGLLDDAARALARWDALTAERRVVTIAGVDAHGGLALERDDTGAGEYKAKPLVRLPSYRAVFRLLDNCVLLDGPLTGDGVGDAAAVIQAVRRGRVSSTVSGAAGPGWVVLSAESNGNRVWMGDTIWPQGPVSFDVTTNAPPSSRILLKRNGTVVGSAIGPSARFVLPAGRGAYRTEVWLPERTTRARIPWGMTNPVYVSYPPDRIPERPFVSPALPDAADMEAVDLVLSGGPSGGAWHVEADPTSRVECSLEGAGDEGTFRVKVSLGQGSRRHPPYGALAVPLSRGSLTLASSIRLVARADRPCRLSIQLRAPDAAADRRWGRSIRLDTHDLPVRLPVAELRPVTAAVGSLDARTLAQVDAVLLVLDTVNLEPGQARVIRFTAPARPAARATSGR